MSITYAETRKIWSKLKKCKFLDKTGGFQSCLKIVNIFLLMCRESDNLSSLINPKVQHWQLNGWHAKTTGGIEHPSQACFLLLIFSFQMEKCAVGPHSEALLWVQCFSYWNTQEPEKGAGRKEVTMVRMESHSCTGHSVVGVNEVRLRTWSTWSTPPVYD